ncbi:hypothetical protein ACRJ4W_39150 [Streptomyces sp. GLT-R25]
MTTTDLLPAIPEGAGTADETLLRLIASALACLSRQRTVPNPVYPAKVQNAYNHLVLHCLRRGEDPPGSVPEMVRWACERPLAEWPLPLPDEARSGTALLVDPETRLPHQSCLEWEVNAADPAAELFENERILEALAICRAARSPRAYTAFRALLTTRPVLTGAELALLGGDPECGMLLHSVIKRCYEPAHPRPICVRARIGSARAATASWCRCSSADTAANWTVAAVTEEGAMALRCAPTRGDSSNSAVPSACSSPAPDSPRRSWKPH